jgi:hypothetical protein
VDDFVEAADLTSGISFLVKECEVLRVEFTEEFLPGDRRKAFVRRFKIKPQQSGLSRPEVPSTARLRLSSVD